MPPCGMIKIFIQATRAFLNFSLRHKNRRLIRRLELIPHEANRRMSTPLGRDTSPSKGPAFHYDQ